VFVLVFGGVLFPLTVRGFRTLRAQVTVIHVSRSRMTLHSVPGAVGWMVGIDVVALAFKGVPYPSSFSPSRIRPWCLALELVSYHHTILSICTTTPPPV
jgi:hypothetical protein